jgi:hypothetical protein
MRPTEDMDHLRVLRDKVGRFREEIADIRELNDQFRRAVRNDAMAQIAQVRRQERLQAIQHELVQLTDLWPQNGFDRTNERRAPLPAAPRETEAISVAFLPGRSS